MVAPPTTPPETQAKRGFDKPSPVKTPSITLSDHDDGESTDLILMDDDPNRVGETPLPPVPDTDTPEPAPPLPLTTLSLDMDADKPVNLIADTSLHEMVARVVQYFHPEPNMTLLEVEGVDISRLNRRKGSITGRMGSRKMSRSLSDRGKNGGTKDDAEWAAELADEVAAHRMPVATARKLFKSSPPEARMDLEWRLVRHLGFPSQLFSTHLWFTDSAKLMREFVRVFHGAVERDRVAVLAAVAWWVAHYSHTTTKAHEPLAELVAAADRDPTLTGLDDLELLRLGLPPDLPTAEARKPGLAPVALAVFHPDQRTDGAGAAHVPPLTEDVSWFLTTPPKELATQLTVLDSTLLSRVGPDEFRVQTRAGTKGLMVTSVLGTAVTHTNNLRAQLVSLILQQEEVEDRAAAVEHIVDVGRHLLELNNFLSLFAVAGAMTHSAVSRLKRTNALLPKATLKVIAMMELVLSPNHNHEAYRQRINNAPHGLPYLGIVLKDLTGLYGLEGWSDDGSRLNFTKYRGVARVLAKVTSAIGRAVHFVADNVDDDDDLVRCLLELASHAPSDDKLYALSLEREPRGQPAAVSGRSRAKSISRGPRNRRRTVSANDKDAIEAAIRQKKERAASAAQRSAKFKEGVKSNPAFTAARAAATAVAERKRMAVADNSELKTMSSGLIAELAAAAAPPRLLKSVESLFAEMQARLENLTALSSEGSSSYRTSPTESVSASTKDEFDAHAGPGPAGTRDNGPLSRTTSEMAAWSNVSQPPPPPRSHSDETGESPSRARTYTIDESEEDLLNAVTCGSTASAPPVLDHLSVYDHFWVDGHDSDNSELDLDDVYSWMDLGAHPLGTEIQI
eukprot:m.78718 g.78718  ORF g.78718 m.78718 type:complete len:850 (+) comp10737_c0_seq1:166-2715(+)